MYRVLASPVSQHTSSQSQAEITGFSQHLRLAVQSLYSHSHRLNTFSSLHATTSPTWLAVRQERSVQRSVESLSVTLQHTSVTLRYRAGPAPHTVTKHHTLPRRDGRSQVAGSQFRPDISSAVSSLSPPIKTDIVTLPLMYVNETLSAASPGAQFSSSQLRTGLSLSDCRDVGVGFQ